jgi:integrase
LREPRPLYYAWEHPDGRILPIGRVPLSVAMSEALAANLHLENQRPTLVERLATKADTVADLLLKMPAATKGNTIRADRSNDNIIRASLGAIACKDLTVKDCADMLEAIAATGKLRSATAVRSRLVKVCKRGQSLGLMSSNPAQATERAKATVKRGRLTLDAFRAIYAVADQVQPWLQRAMMLSLVTGADVSTVASAERTAVADGCLVLTRQKTGARIAIPTVLRLNAVGVTLTDLLRPLTAVVSRYIVHHTVSHGRAQAGAPLSPVKISKAFTAARVLAGVPDVDADGKSAVTFHELRSLAARLYKEQGGVDVQALLGHTAPEMTAKYQDARGVEPTRVRVG